MSFSYNKKSGPFLSIIIATLNVEKTLEKCLESIIQQTSFNRIEILVKDGGSIDKTIDILNAYDEYVSYWESSPDAGIYDAWNKVLSRTIGEWVLFLGADDVLFENETISNAASILKGIDSGFDIAYGKVRLVSSNSEMILDLGKNWDSTKKCIKEKMCMPHQGIFHKKLLFDKNGKFNIEYKISADYDFIRRVILENNVFFMNMVVSCMGTGGISSDPKNTFVRLKEIRLINKEYGDKIPGPLWLITFTNACFRHSLYFLIGKKSTEYILDRLRILVGLPRYWTKI